MRRNLGLVLGLRILESGRLFTRLILRRMNTPHSIVVHKTLNTCDTHISELMISISFGLPAVFG